MNKPGVVLISTLLIVMVMSIISIQISKNFFRPSEVDYLKGDFSKARKLLKWKPGISTLELIDDMVQSELDKY